MRQFVRYVCIPLLGISVICLAIIITYGFAYMAGEFKDDVSRTYGFQNMAASFLFIIVFVKYIFWEKKCRWLHYYLVAYAAFVSIYLEITEKAIQDIVRLGVKHAAGDLLGTLHGLSFVIVPFAFAIILLFDEIKQSIMNSSSASIRK